MAVLNEIHQITCENHRLGSDTWYCGLSVLHYLSVQENKLSSEIVEEALEGELTDKEAYWFEMHSIEGWEKVILVFGYWDNASACEELVVYGERTSPGRSFQCVEVR